MSALHRNIPIFIPHLGCPNQCVFCNQRSISGCRSFHEEDVRRQIETALSTIPQGTDTEIAFFGGSFTGIDRALMLRLLDTAEDYVRAGRVSSIRLSTRPDYISDEILSVLSSYTVKHIELGLQSMDDSVLAASKRGHSVADSVRACRAVTAAGFALTGQMMIGLPASTPESEVQTAQMICELGATTARIYPTVVFYDTPLCEMAERGDYLPLTVEAAVQRSANALEVFAAHDVLCIRMGLCASEDLTDENTVYAGPNHPALGELILSECYFRRMKTYLAAHGLVGGDVILRVPEKETSQAVGQRRSNLARLRSECGTHVVRVLQDAQADQFCFIKC